MSDNDCLAYLQERRKSSSSRRRNVDNSSSKNTSADSVQVNDKRIELRYKVLEQNTKAFIYKLESSENQTNINENTNKNNNKTKNNGNIAFETYNMDSMGNIIEILYKPSSSVCDNNPKICDQEKNFDEKLIKKDCLIQQQNEKDQQEKKQQQQQLARKLDESEVLIVSSSFVEEDSAYATGGSTEENRLLDTSHVSVVTVGDEIKVKDSSNIRAESSSDLSSVGAPNESTDDWRSGATDPISIKNKVNGQLIKTISQSREDVIIIVNRKKTKPEKRISPDSSVGSMDSRTHSECGSVRSTGTPTGVIKIDRSDAESIATTANHDSREPEEEVIIRRTKPEKVERTKEEIELHNLRKKTRKRTRKFEIDGVQVTTTTSKVIYGDEDNGRLYDDHIFRKQELRELKMLQKQEKKQLNDLQLKEQIVKEQQERRFDQERIALEKTYESDMDTLARQQKQLIEKTEQQQEAELRASSKKIRSEQDALYGIPYVSMIIINIYFQYAQKQLFIDHIGREHPQYDASVLGKLPEYSCVYCPHQAMKNISE